MRTKGVVLTLIFIVSLGFLVYWAANKAFSRSSKVIYIADPAGAIDGRSISVNGRSLGLIAGAQLYEVDADIATVTFRTMNLTFEFEGAKRGDLVQFLPIPNGDGSSNIGYYICDPEDLKSCVVIEKNIIFFRLIGKPNL